MAPAGGQGWFSAFKFDDGGARWCNTVNDKPWTTQERRTANQEPFCGPSLAAIRPPMPRGSFALALVLALVTAGIAETGTFSDLSGSPASATAGDTAAAREQEWIVSEIARSMLNAAAYAGHFDAGDPFQVRRVGAGSTGARRFRLTRGAEEYTVTTDRPWMPEPYTRMATTDRLHFPPLAQAFPSRQVPRTSAWGARLGSARSSSMAVVHEGAIP